MAKLVPIDAVKGAEYNPRKNDENRLALTELSLRKLGFLLPIYADATGEILSGHQRQLVAKRMGFKEIPVEYVSAKTEDKRRAINILFNRATNDMRKQATTHAMTQRLYGVDVAKLAEELPDVEIGSRDSYPCIYKTRKLDTTMLAKANFRKFDASIKRVQKSLERNVGKAMPIVVDEKGEVLNGIGRLQAAAESGKKVVVCVEVANEKAELAKQMLNLLTMDFDVKESYADELRYNSYMRSRNTRDVSERGEMAMGNGFYKGLWPDRKGRDFYTLKGAELAAWKQHYGDTIVDFGAGKLSNTRILRQAGISVSAFEPYFVGANDRPHKEESVEMTEQFLEDVESGKAYSSVFISSVFNSVPFMEDRMHIAVIVAALCFPEGKAICWCQSDKAAQFRQGKVKSIGTEKVLTFALDYEPNVMLGSVDKNPKVQKGHTDDELRAIFLPCFEEENRMEMIHAFWYAEFSKPKINPAMLADALDFEFELPYPDGTRMGLSDRAREAFEKRLGIKLPERKSR